MCGRVTPSQPTIALAMGDRPASARADGEAGRARRGARRRPLVVIGDGASSTWVRMAGVASRSTGSGRRSIAPGGRRRSSSISRISIRPRSRAGSRAARRRIRLANYRHALARGRARRRRVLDPFNKQAMRLAEPSLRRRDRITAGVLGTQARRAIQHPRRLWNARVTSHIPMADMPSDSDGRRHRQAHGAHRRRRCARRLPATAHRRGGAQSARRRRRQFRPRGDRRHRARGPAASVGIRAEGPFPADTVFVRARRGEFDAVLTMYHDQGQIAMKLMGFDRGVTLLGGFPFPHRRRRLHRQPHVQGAPPSGLTGRRRRFVARQS